MVEQPAAAPGEDSKRDARQLRQGGVRLLLLTAATGRKKWVKRRKS